MLSLSCIINHYVLKFGTFVICYFIFSGDGVAAPPTKESATGEGSKDKGGDILQKQETMFSSMERQYEMARIATHTHKGFGLGFTSQSFIPK